jgi:hypothetical protein
MIAPRVRVRVRRRCDDECPSVWQHPIAVAAATVAYQVIGEVVVKRLTATASEPEPEQPAPPPRKRGGGA